jgi:hypothetical protein
VLQQTLAYLPSAARLLSGYILNPHQQSSSAKVIMAIAYFSTFQYVDIDDGEFRYSPLYTSIEVNDDQEIPGRYTLTFNYDGTPGIDYVEFAGYTSNGDPVFVSTFGEYQYLSNGFYPGSTPPAFTPGTFVACFLAGTLISTPQGPTEVQDIKSGDLVLNADGHPTAVKWIGRQTVAQRFTSSDERAAICMEAGALGDSLPTRDLKLTADHALLIDGVLVQAGALVNGTTIRRMTAAETGAVYTVWHIETEGHQIILAEGCPAETFIDNISRKRFDNYAEYEALFGEEANAMPEMDLPRVKSARQLPASIRDLVAVRRAA